MVQSRIWLSLCLLVLMASSANARVTDLKIRQSPVPDGVIAAGDGYIANDLLIDFEGDLHVQKLIVKLDSGSIYQDTLGSELPPESFLVNLPAFPALQYDSFVTLGGFIRETSEQILIIGQCNPIVDICAPVSRASYLPVFHEEEALEFDNEAISIGWVPAAGVVIPRGKEYPVARITWSPDANGVLYYFGSTSGNDPPVIARGVFRNGIIGSLVIVPEPTSLTLINLLALALATKRRRSNHRYF